MYSVEILADSKRVGSPHRITTMKVTFPRYLLAEFNTHRMFSRNSASSRAIPFEKLLKTVKENPFIPIAWQKDHSGMQGTEYFTDKELIENNVLDWLYGRDKAIETAIRLSETGVTKQIVNRKLEPYMWHTCIVTATEWENFFFLRCPKYTIGDIRTTGEAGVGVEVKTYRSRKDTLKELPNLSELDRHGWLKANLSGAEIHFQEIAEMMWDAYNESTPKELQPGEWHIPLGDKIDNALLQTYIDKIIATKGYESISTDFLVQYTNNSYPDALKVKIATARCGRVSYTTVGEEGKPDNYEKDVDLHDRSVKNAHWSMFEHCAQCMDDTEMKINMGVVLHIKDGVKSYQNVLGVCGNFIGFTQYRKMFTNENVTK